MKNATYKEMVFLGIGNWALGIGHGKEHTNEGSEGVGKPAHRTASPMPYAPSGS